MRDFSTWVFCSLSKKMGEMYCAGVEMAVSWSSCAFQSLKTTISVLKRLA